MADFGKSCTHANFRFLNHISAFLKPTAMKHLGILRTVLSSILQWRLKLVALPRKAQHTSASWREKIQSPQNVCSPLYAAPLSFFLRTWDFITKSRITTWVFPKNCTLGTSTEHKMWPEMDHWRWVHGPKTRVLTLRNTLELAIVSEN